MQTHWQTETKTKNISYFGEGTVTPNALLMFPSWISSIHQCIWFKEFQQLYLDNSIELWQLNKGFQVYFPF